MGWVRRAAVQGASAANARSASALESVANQQGRVGFRTLCLQRAACAKCVREERKVVLWVCCRRRPWRGRSETRANGKRDIPAVAALGGWRCRGGVGAVPVFAGKRKKSAAWPPPLRRPGRRGRPCSSLLLLAACGARRVAAEPRGGGEGDGSARVRGIGFYSPFRSWLAADGEDTIGTRVGRLRSRG